MQEEILHELLNLGEAMLANGAEINRVEDTLNRMGKAYGACRMNVFVITSCMVVTMSFSDGREITQARRILRPGVTDFRKLEDFNALSRRCCEQPIPLEDFRTELGKIQNVSQERRKFYLGSALAAGLGIGVLARLNPYMHMDKIMIGDIMLLIPRIAMTNAVRDVLGDTISGIMRLVETLLWAGALACGFMAAI